MWIVSPIREISPERWVYQEDVTNDSFHIGYGDENWKYISRDELSATNGIRNGDRIVYIDDFIPVNRKSVKHPDDWCAMFLRLGKGIFKTKDEAIKMAERLRDEFIKSNERYPERRDLVKRHRALKWEV
jgi:hypothetical protein